ncbi:sigma-70 family RNA polymerase sigma factor [Myxococcus sp. K38C18041901]|uniref:sigma-70 family RNA polymerase sigma factor n=1 Tax=Myxococcus guangdongensis TaxID=2906760 RepID=UPI0020A6F812|nr:sigma-70 family RNA polymerase sigma factor [Myxococcus guangdongensis]MCP3060961.1 sigma-70 family RNA polymerase sigma factor [Myxococcus guangdongensis]
MQCRGKHPWQRLEQGRGAKASRTLNPSQGRDAPSALSRVVEELALEILRLRDEGAHFSARRLSGELLVQMEPALRTLVRRFAKSRGSLSVDDLVQVARLEAVKALDTYRPEKKGSQCFVSWATWRARRVLREHVRLHAVDVRPSDAAQRGRTRSGRTDAPTAVISRDEPRESQSGAELEAHDAARAMEYLTAEELLSVGEQVARMYFALAEMEPLVRELVSRVYGLGRTRQSIRDLAREWGMPRWRLDALLARARVRLRRKLEEE